MDLRDRGLQQRKVWRDATAYGMGAGVGGMITSWEDNKMRNGR